MREPGRGTRVTLVTSDLGPGGAERALVLIAGGLQSLGYSTTVVTLRERREDFYEMAEGVVRVCAGHAVRGDVRWWNLPGQLRRLAAVRSMIAGTRPDVLISFQDGVNELVLLSCVGKSFAKMISCQNDISQRRHINRRWAAARRFAYPLADRVVFLDKFQSSAAAGKYRRWRCTGIPNPIPWSEIERGRAEDPEFPVDEIAGGFIVAMGRLTPQKGFDLLIRAYSRLQRRSEVQLVIIGEGDERDRLRELSRSLEVDDAVWFAGLLRNPFSLISRARVFVLSSRYEGQGLALIEAMACKVPVVSFDCPSGPGLVIESGRNGLLAKSGDPDSLAHRIDEILSDPQRAAALAEYGQAAAKAYSPDGIARNWHTLIRELVRGAQPGGLGRAG